MATLELLVGSSGLLLVALWCQEALKMCRGTPGGGSWSLMGLPWVVLSLPWTALGLLGGSWPSLGGSWPLLGFPWVAFGLSEAAFCAFKGNDGRKLTRGCLLVL